MATLDDLVGGRARSPLSGVPNVIQILPGTIGNAAAQAPSIDLLTAGGGGSNKPIPQVAPPTNPAPPIVAPTPLTPTPVGSPFSSKAFKDIVNQWIQPNVLNKFWQPTYHFRLFMAGDGDMLKTGTPSTNIHDLINKVNGNQISQVTIAESGVTGYNIKDVEIDTVNSQNPQTREQKATTFIMTVTEPMGVSFLDALYGAGSYLEVYDYTKMIYFIQLTFTGYNEDGSFAGDPLPTGFPNGGQWIWAVKLTLVETKLNEGAATYTLHFVITEAEPVLLEEKTLANVKQAIVAKGNTLQVLFDDYAKKLTDAWTAEYGKDPKNKQLMVFRINAQHPIQFDGNGVKAGDKPGDFVVPPQNRDQSSIKAFALSDVGGTSTVTAQAGTTINEFISSAIKNTEKGQALIKDDPTIASNDTPNEKIRVSKLFSIEIDPEQNGWDAQSGNYAKIVTIHVVPTMSQAAILSRTQTENANDPQVQRNMITKLGTQGFLCKRYDYIFTGNNTEVIDFDIKFNLAWQAMLPKLAGIRMNFLNEAVHARSNPQSDTSEVKTVPNIQPLNQPSSGIPGVPVIAPVVPAVVSMTDPVPANVAAATTAAQTLKSTAQVTDDALKRLRANVQSTTNVAIQAKPTKIYIEDILSRLNQGERNVLPISFSNHYHDVERNQGTGGDGQYHKDKSVAGAVFSQIFGNMTDAFLNIDITIRGDPYWLGQSNLERQLVLRSSDTSLTHDAANLPSWSSGNPTIFLYFRYPLQLGDDFKPILQDSLAFSGLYEITTIKHTFSEGAYKQVLHGVRMSLINLDLAYTVDPNSVGNDQASPPTGPATSQVTSGAGVVTPGTGSSRIAPTGSLPNDASQQQLAKQSYSFWTSQGYSPAAASGMVAQEEAESHFGTDPRTNASASAQGNFQWSPARAAAIQSATGIDVSTADHNGQLKAAAWELSSTGPEHSAGTAIRGATDGGNAGSVAAVKYERPRDLQGAAQVRGGRGAFWQTQLGSTA